MGKHLIEVGEWKSLTRPASVHLDSDEVLMFIQECEDIYIIPAIGSGLYDKMIEGIEGNNIGDDLKLLLEGGEWSDDGGTKHILRGLKSALAYYVYAKMSRMDGAIIGRSGYVQHSDEYAVRMDDKNRVNRYNDTMNVAEKYLSDCKEYIGKKIDGGSTTRVRGTRVRIIDVGD